MRPRKSSKALTQPNPSSEKQSARNDQALKIQTFDEQIRQIRNVNQNDMTSQIDASTKVFRITDDEEEEEVKEVS